MIHRHLRLPVEIVLACGQLDDLDALQRPAVGIRAGQQLLLGFRKRDVEALLAQPGALAQKLEGKRRLPGARRAVDEVEPVRDEAAVEDVVQAPERRFGNVSLHFHWTVSCGRIQERGAEHRHLGLAGRESFQFQCAESPPPSFPSRQRERSEPVVWTRNSRPDAAICHGTRVKPAHRILLGSHEFHRVALQFQEATPHPVTQAPSLRTAASCRDSRRQPDPVLGDLSALPPHSQ